MVCDSCQSKLSKVCVPDKWKAGATNTLQASSSMRAGKTNKALQAKKAKAEWIPQNNSCRLCKSKTLNNMKFCNDCAHKKGICSMCGKKSVDVSSHRMSLT